MLLDNVPQRGSSARLEQGAHNAQVAGSNPARATISDQPANDDSPVNLLVPAHLAKKPLDTLRRVFVPIEEDGMFATTDGRMYRRVAKTPDGTGRIERMIPKVRGKAARAADKRARRAATRANERRAREAHG